jgi:hypothetical protein
VGEIIAVFTICALKRVLLLLWVNPVRAGFVVLLDQFAQLALNFLFANKYFIASTLIKKKTKFS